MAETRWFIFEFRKFRERKFGHFWLGGWHIAVQALDPTYLHFIGSIRFRLEPVGIKNLVESWYLNLYFSGMLLCILQLMVLEWELRLVLVLFDYTSIYRVSLGRIVSGWEPSGVRILLWYLVWPIFYFFLVERYHDLGCIVLILELAQWRWGLSGSIKRWKHRRLLPREVVGWRWVQSRL